MADIKLCAFADEAGDSLAEQIKAMQENGIGLLELRTIEKKNVTKFTDDEVKEYKKNPEAYKGHVGDAATIIRVAITGRTNSPDLCSIMALLGKNKVCERIENAIAHFEEV